MSRPSTPRCRRERTRTSSRGSSASSGRAMCCWSVGTASPAGHGGFRVARNSAFDTASVTKLFTAVAVLQQIEQHVGDGLSRSPRDDDRRGGDAISLAHAYVGDRRRRGRGGRGGVRDALRQPPNPLDRRHGRPPAAVRPQRAKVRAGPGHAILQLLLRVGRAGVGDGVSRLCRQGCAATSRDPGRPPRAHLLGRTKTILGAALMLWSSCLQVFSTFPSIVRNVFGPVRSRYMPMWLSFVAKFEPSRS